MQTASLDLSKILVATDLSDQSGLAIQRALELSHESGSEVIIAHVIDEGLPSNAQSFLASTSDHYIRSRLSEFPQSADVKLTIDIITGRPETDIAERAEIENAGCIVAGLHNRILEENLAIEGTLGEQIIRATHRPVLLVKNRPRGPYRSVVVGVDFSAYSRTAFQAAAAIAPNAMIHLVHAYTAIVPRPFIARMSDDQTRSKQIAADRARLQAFIDGELHRLKDTADIDPARIQCHSGEGDPHIVIRQAATRHEADLIVVGTHARVGIQRTFLGSVSTDLINDRIADVLVVRPY